MEPATSAASAPEAHPGNKPAETLTTFKGFGLDWKCRDFQYEVGKTFEHNGPVEACASGFHACENPLDVFRYYALGTSRFALVEQSGELARHREDSKVASKRITIKAEISLPGLIKAAIDYTFSRALPIDPASPASATDDSGAASATGYRGAASATGYSGAASATGYSGAASATGDSGAASATGKKSTAMACGRFGRAIAAEGCALFLAERDGDWNIVAVWAGIAGRDGIKPDTWYTLTEGKPVEVGV